MSEIQWRELLSTLHVTEEEGTELSSEHDLSNFELEFNVRLPSGYKHFCQIFGTGLIGDFLRIYCPSRNLVGSQEVIMGMAEQLRDHPSGNAKRDQEYIELLNLSLGFADDFGNVMFSWDLRTFSELDNSYDIYCGVWESPDEDDPILVGRDFFEFIQDFCLGRRAYEILPDSLKCIVPEEIPLTFERFKPSEWNPSYQPGTN
jgi:SMI1 / KNR4 family (SUKH-1)